MNVIKQHICTPLSGPQSQRNLYTLLHSDSISLPFKFTLHRRIANACQHSVRTLVFKSRPNPTTVNPSGSTTKSMDHFSCITAESQLDIYEF